MTDTDKRGEWATYRIVVSHREPQWIATAHGPGLPDEGLSASLRSLTDLDDEASTLVEQADTPEPFPSRRSWHYEYELGPDGGDVLEGFRLASLAHGKAFRDWASRGHDITSALAKDMATLGEIAAVMNVDYWEVARLLSYQPRPHHLVRGWTHPVRSWAHPIRWRHEVTESAAYEAAWTVRVLRLVAEDKLREKRERRRVSA
jgi:hypothetical protein